MSSHKILETERARLARGRKCAEKQFRAAQQMKQENNDLMCSFNPSSASDATLSRDDHAMPSRIPKDCETEVLLNTNFASGCAEGNLEKDGISDQSKKRCGGSTIDKLDIAPKNSQDSNTMYDKEANISQCNLTSQGSCTGYNFSDNSEGSPD